MSRDAAFLHTRRSPTAPHAQHHGRRLVRRPLDKAAWYAPAAFVLDVTGAIAPVWWIYAATDQPHPAGAAFAAAAVWLGIQTAHQRYSTRLIGESRGLLAVLHDWLTLLGLLAVLRVATGEGSSPAYALLALTPLPVLVGTGRVVTHLHLRAQRRQAHAVSRVLAVGSPEQVDQLVGQLSAGTDHPYVVTGALTVGVDPLQSGVPQTGQLLGGDVPAEEGLALLEAARTAEAEVVMVVPGPSLTGERLRRLSWAAQDAGLPVVVASGLTDVALRRVRLSTAAGLNLLHVAPPVRRGPQLLAKGALDRAGAALGLLLLAPLFALLVAAVRLDSRGPAFYRQTRVGQRGTLFTMWKFRSMVLEADALRAQLAEADEQDGPMFKIRRDPRVTRVGRVLRRTSLDELPQLVNVLKGHMSLVGPRPALPDEVAAYDAASLRRLHVKPGMTGPWQVGGRSDLSWDESVSIDLEYADNWSLTTDLDVLARTARAVVDGRGAY